MANITEDYVSFKTAKLLKEKGFDVQCKNYFSLNNDAIRHNLNKKYGAKKNWNSIELCVSRPSQSLAMKWLREVHKLWIDFSVFCPAPEGMHKQEDCIPRYYYRIKKYNIGYMDFITSDEHILNFPSYEQAVEAAIKYCLENLI